ncbi:MAG TPA: hypothetical protein VFW17_01995 [Ktedonobacterales bacterium]|jgi:hypothetical protein|nr:hypothetical protein [Ktedonobacterales bacterium]
MTSAQTRGLMIGLALGVVWAWLGFGAMVLTGVLAIVGWLIGTAINSLSAGNINLADLWSDLQGRRSQS